MLFWAEARSTKAPCGTQPSSTEYQNSSQVFGRHSHLQMPCAVLQRLGLHRRTGSVQDVPLAPAEVSVGIWGFCYEKRNHLFNCPPVRVGSLGSNTYTDSLQLYDCLCLALASITITFLLPGAQGQFYQKKKSTWTLFNSYYLPATWKAITRYIDKCCCCSSKELINSAINSSGDCK